MVASKLTRRATYCAGILALAATTLNCGGDDSENKANGGSGGTGTGGTGTGGTVATGGAGGTGVTGGTGGTAGTAQCALEGGVKGFALQHAIGEGYWYSRYNLGAQVMMSGAGEGFMPPAGGPEAMVTMASDTLSTAMLPKNPALILRPFSYGNPALANKNNGDDMDFANGRWIAIPAADQAKSNAGAWAWTVTKELEWAKQFHVDAHFGIPGKNDIPGAQERFAGLVLFAEALMSANDWMANPSKYDMTKLEDRYAALITMADLAGMLMVDTLPHSSSNRYKKMAQDMAPMMGMDPAKMMADMSSGMQMMFNGLEVGTTVRETAIGVQALVWYLGVAPDDATKKAVRDKIAANADKLLGLKPATAAELGYQIRGLADAWRVSKDSKYLDAAASAFAALETAYDCKHGVFTNQTTYTPDDVAGVVAGLNAVMTVVTTAKTEIDFARPSGLLTGFWEGTVNISGLQATAYPVKAPYIQKYEVMSDELFHRYPTQPFPPAGGGANGVAPVFIKSVTFDPASAKWTADQSRFDASGAMHLANEALWLHTDEVNGFPDVQ